MDFDLFTYVQELVDSEDLAAIVNNPLAQFGTMNRQYMGATILPERIVEDNMYREIAMRYMSVIANDGERYSPAQKKSAGNRFAEMEIVLGDSDIQAEFTAREMDMFIRLMGQNREMDAQVEALRWVNNSIVRPLVELVEKQRWEALITGGFVRKGNNNFTDPVAYDDVAGHRVSVTDAWDTPSGDPFEDMYAITNMLRDKGYIVNRCITSRRVLTAMMNNPNVRQRAGFARLEINSSATLSANYGRVTQATLNAALAEDELPMIETYDLQYQDYDGWHYFLPRDVMFFACTTGQDARIVEDEQELRLLPNVLGYTAIGRGVGVATAGRVVRMWAKDDKPPRILAEGWQTTLPVIVDPEALGVLKDLLT